MASLEDVAKWMVEQVETNDWLYQEHAVYEIANRFGDEFTGVNNNGNPSIKKNVLKAFGELTKDSVVWSRSERYWRRRNADDPVGKRQVD